MGSYIYSDKECRRLACEAARIRGLQRHLDFISLDAHIAMSADPLYHAALLLLSVDVHQLVEVLDNIVNNLPKPQLLKGPTS